MPREGPEAGDPHKVLQCSGISRTRTWYSNHCEQERQIVVSMCYYPTPGDTPLTAERYLLKINLNGSSQFEIVSLMRFSGLKPLLSIKVDGGKGRKTRLLPGPDEGKGKKFPCTCMTGDFLSHSAIIYNSGTYRMAWMKTSS